MEAERRVENPVTKTEGELVVCCVDYFQEIGQLKTFLKKLGPDIQQLVGPGISAMVAARRRPSIGNKVLLNKKIGILKTETNESLCKSTYQFNTIQITKLIY